MKSIILTIGFLTSVLTMYSQDALKQDPQKLFIVLYTIGENWDTTKQFSQQLYASEHSAHLSELIKTNKISIGARYSDTGMVILKAKDQTEAQKIIHEDLAIQNKIFRTEIHPFYVFYGGCID